MCKEKLHAIDARSFVAVSIIAPLEHLCFLAPRFGKARAQNQKKKVWGSDIAPEPPIVPVLSRI
jgi:hypothetical protein